MIGIGPLEIMVLLVVALIVIGPERMPELARSLARLMRDLRGMMDEVRGHFDDLTREDLFDTKEINSYYRETIDGVKKIVEPPEEIEKGLSGAGDEVKEAQQEFQEFKEDLEEEFEGSLKYLGEPIEEEGEESEEETQEKPEEEPPKEPEAEDTKTGKLEPDEPSPDSSGEPSGPPS